MVNKVILIGNVGQDPEFHTFDSGDKVASFSLATSERWKDKEGNQKDSTEWHNIQAFGKLPSIIEQYVKKGDKLYLEGKIKTRMWEKDNEKRYITEVHVQTLKMLGSKSEKSNSSSGGNNTPPPPDNTDAPF